MRIHDAVKKSDFIVAKRIYQNTLEQGYLKMLSNNNK